MPELPDVVLYIETLTPRVAGQTLQSARVISPLFLRTYDPPLSEAEGRTVEKLSRMGKRVVFELAGELFLVFHLMIAGRFQWRQGKAAPPRRYGLAAFQFPTGALIVTEAGNKRRASLHVVQGRGDLEQLNPGGLEVMSASLDAFRDALVRENHTLKRALTDPHLFSGIGNSYSDEILHHARLSPFKLTGQLSAEETERLHRSCKEVLSAWLERLRTQAGTGFPEKVTAFRAEMAVHGRYREPCPVCGTPVQRIVYAENECNYCPTCQTGGRLLADRALSRLLKKDWPRTVAELEDLRRPRT
jgi:formamidopyrimidine-DNA glycosylase